MKTNIVEMPHMMERAGDLCISQSVAANPDKHPGALWLYFLLPGMTTPRALRIVDPESWVFHTLRKSDLVVHRWDGDKVYPTLDTLLENDSGDQYQLLSGILTPQPSRQGTLL